MLRAAMRLARPRLLAAAAVLVPLTAAACTPTTSPPSTAAGLTPGPIASAVTAARDAGDLKASHGLVEGAAGSRGTALILVSVDACSVDAFPSLGLRDATGASLIGAASIGPGRIDLAPGVAYQSDVRIANWCIAEPAFPLELELIVGGQEVSVTGSSFPEDGDLPARNGEGRPLLEGGAWTASPP
jgi:hypothetical protein